MRVNSTLASRICAVLISLSLTLTASGPHAWASPVVSGSIGRVPVGIQAGAAGAVAANAVSVQLAELPMRLDGTLFAPKTQLPTPDITPTLAPTLVPGVELSAPKAVPGSQFTARMAGAEKTQSGRNVERHPVIDIINKVHQAGIALPDGNGSAADAAQVKAAAEALPDGKAKQNLMAFAEAMSAPGHTAQGRNTGKLFDNGKALMPAVDAPEATGIWARIARAKTGLIPSGLKRYAAAKAEAARQKARTIDTDKLKVPTKDLRYVPDVEDIPESTRGIKPDNVQIVGQKRGMESLEFGLKMEGRGYNVVVVGADGTGRQTAVRQLLSKIAPHKPTPGDMVQVTNFQNTDNPVILKFQTGTGRKFAHGVKSAVETLKTQLPKMLSGGQMEQAQKQMLEKFQTEAQAKQAALDAEVAKVKIKEIFGIKIEVKQIGENRIGIMAVLTMDGTPVKPEFLDSLIEGESYTKEELLAEMQAVAKPFIEKYSALLQEQQEAMGAIQEQLQGLVSKMVNMMVQQIGGQLQGLILPSQVDEAAAKALQEKLGKRIEDFTQEANKALEQNKIGPLTLQLMVTQTGLGMSLNYKGQPIDQNIFAQLQEKGEIAKDLTWEAAIAQAQEAAKPHIGKFQEMMALNQKDIAEFQAAQEKNKVKPTTDQLQAMAWLKSFMADLTANFPLFLASSMDEETAARMPDPAKRYIASVLVGNSRTKGAPVIFEKNPTFERLFGRAEDNSQMMMIPGVGAAKTESPGGPTLKGGSYLRANGGYLVLELLDVLREPNVYPALSQMIRSGKAVIREGGMMGLMTQQGNAYQVDADVKVVLLASPMLRMLLEHHDEDFNSLFRAVAEFENAVAIGADTVAYYLKFIRKMVDATAGAVMHFTRGGVAGVLEYAARLADSNKKLSVQFGTILTLLREASYWAKQAGHEEVQREDVDKAIAERVERRGSTRRHIHELYSTDSFTIQVEGTEIGQINGLAVMMSGMGFGVPARITAVASAGRAGQGITISADQDAGSVGSSFKKALSILEGFFEKTFAQKTPIPARVRISFEQNYGGIDGDSATQTQIYAALSSLAQVPIRQGIAITGSADQFGNVQPIGGVNEKIEGYYDVVKAKLAREGREMTGEQGVMIPVANVGDLMLRPDIVEAVRQGKFTIWAVSHVSQGVEILTGEAYSEVKAKAEKRLMGFRAAAMAGAGK